MAASAAFAAALAVASEVSTRTRVTVVQKNDARTVLRKEVRTVAAMVRAFPGTTPDMLAMLGLKPPKRRLTPKNPPATRPSAHVRKRDSLMHELYISDQQNTTRRARPDDAIGALVFASVVGSGESPSESLEDYRFCGIATREIFTIRYRPADANKTAYIVARWFNRRGLGPVSHTTIAAVAA